ncbi:MAG: hypothetical protein A2Z05_08300 [Chloroflexi bacterium RBG_16_60_22]|nr:MAG: hypothetical protein A2Z05_08300 [Chloroflexi bacterium RBG_16_60_22]
MKYAYYPGCSQETTSAEYNRSAVEVCRALEIELVEIPDWNCCGASSCHAVDDRLAHALVGRNLAIAEKEGTDLAVVCPACFLRLRKTRKEFRDDAALREKLPGLIDMPYSARYEVRHLLDILANTVGFEKVAEKVKKPLAGLKVVAYYGCYLVRPPEVTGIDDPENPQIMDTLLKALGADALDWRGKVECCGGSLLLTRRDIEGRLVAGICEAAREVGAEAIVTACGLCQHNLETGQPGENPLPVFYFTELMGLAYGLDARPWLRRHLVNPASLLKKHGFN